MSIIEEINYNPTVPPKRPTVAEWYSGKTILITGSTGFMGKVLVEKLLRDCQDVKRLYLLIRAKKGIEPEARREQYLKCLVSLLCLM